MNKRLVIISASGIAVLGLVWLLTRGGEVANADPAIAAVIKLEQSKDVVSLGEAVKSPDEKVAREALKGLRAVGGGKVVERMRPALSDPRKSVRHAGLVQIGQLGADGGESVSAVASLVKRDSEPEVRAAAATALGNLLASVYAGEPLTAAEIEPIVAALDDADPVVRRSAINALHGLLRVRYQQFDPDGLPGERQKAVREIRSVLAQNLDAWNTWKADLSKEGKVSK